MKSYKMTKNSNNSSNFLENEVILSNLSTYLTIKDLRSLSQTSQTIQTILPKKIFEYVFNSPTSQNYFFKFHTLSKKYHLKNLQNLRKEGVSFQISDEQCGIIATSFPSLNWL